jgi:uncharacterized membrane protein
VLRCALVLAAAVALAHAGDVSDADVLAISHKHCVPCHAREPQHPAFDKPPRDIVLETIEDLKRHAAKVREQTVETRVMPLGNQTDMTEAEREALGRWIAALK